MREDFLLGWMSLHSIQSFGFPGTTVSKTGTALLFIRFEIDENQGLRCDEAFENFQNSEVAYAFDNQGLAWLPERGIQYSATQRGGVRGLKLFTDRLKRFSRKAEAAAGGDGSYIRAEAGELPSQMIGQCFRDRRLSRSNSAGKRDDGGLTHSNSSGSWSVARLITTQPRLSRFSHSMDWMAVRRSNHIKDP